MSNFCPPAPPAPPLPPPPRPLPPATDNAEVTSVIPSVAPANDEDKTRIEKLVSYVARNGLAFQDMVKEKEKDNALFGFLFDGEHSVYYQWRLLCVTRQYSDDTVRQLLQQHATRLESTPLGALDLTAADKASLQAQLQSNSGSKDSIRALRVFIMARAHSGAAIGKELKLYTKHLVSPAESKPEDGQTSHFTKILHMIYVINDVFFNHSRATFRGPYTDFIADLTPDWVPASVDLVPVLLPQVIQILTMAYNYTTVTTEREKLMKLIGLWVTKQFLTESQAAMCRSAMTSPQSAAPPPPDPLLFPPHVLHLPPPSSPVPQHPPSSGLSQRSQTFPATQPAFMQHPPPPHFQAAPTITPPHLAIPPAPRPFVPPGLSFQLQPPTPTIDLQKIPVGMMADIVRNILNLGHKPYGPLSSSQISQPSITPTIEPGRLEARVLDFYRKVEKAQQVDDDQQHGAQRSGVRERGDDYDRRTRKRSRGNSFADEVDMYRQPPSDHNRRSYISSAPSHSMSGGSEGRGDGTIQDDNVGHQMLRGLGWQDGEGLGQSKSGITAPVAASDHHGRVGLGGMKRGGREMGEDFYRSNQSAGFRKT